MTQKPLNTKLIEEIEKKLQGVILPILHLSYPEPPTKVVIEPDKLIKAIHIATQAMAEFIEKREKR